MSTGAEKASDKIPHSFTIDSQHLGMGGPQLDKEHLQRPSADSPMARNSQLPQQNHRWALAPGAGSGFCPGGAKLTTAPTPWEESGTLRAGAQTRG